MTVTLTFVFMVGRYPTTPSLPTPLLPLLTDRCASLPAGGVTALREVRCSHVTVEPAGHPEASAEGAHLALWTYDELKAEKSRKRPVQLSCTDGGR